MVEKKKAIGLTPATAVPIGPTTVIGIGRTVEEARRRPIVGPVTTIGIGRTVEEARRRAAAATGFIGGGLREPVVGVSAQERREQFIAETRARLERDRPAIEADVAAGEKLRESIDVKSQQFEAINRNLGKFGISVNERGEVTRPLDAPRTLQISKSIDLARSILRERNQAAQRFNVFIGEKNIGSRIESFNLEAGAVSDQEKIRERRELEKAAEVRATVERGFEEARIRAERPRGVFQEVVRPAAVAVEEEIFIGGQRLGAGLAEVSQIPGGLAGVGVVQAFTPFAVPALQVIGAERQRRIAKRLQKELPGEAEQKAVVGLTGQLGFFFLPGGVGLAGRGIAALTAPTIEEAAITTGVGFGVGFGFRAAPPLVGLGRTFIPKVQLSQLVRSGLGFSEKVISKGLAPAIGGVVIAGEALSLAEAFPDEAAFRKRRQETIAQFGGFLLGAGFGGRVAGKAFETFEGPGGRISRRRLEIKDTARARKFAERFKVAQKFEKLSIKPGNVDLAKAERVTPKTGRIVEKFLRKNTDVWLGGSASQAAQFPKGVKKPPVGDVDLYARNERAVAERIFNLLKAAGKDVRLRKQKATTTWSIFETVKGTSAKAIEVHNIAQLRQNIGEVRPFFEPTGASIVISSDGISILKLATQAKRKVIGGTFEAAKRPEDIPQFEEFFRPLIEKRVFPLKPTISQRLIGLKGLGRRGFIGTGGVPGGFTVSQISQIRKRFGVSGVDIRTAALASFVLPSGIQVRGEPLLLAAPSAVRKRREPPTISGVPIRDLGFVPSGVPVRRRREIPSGVPIRRRREIPSGVPLRKLAEGVSFVPLRRQPTRPSAVRIRRERQIPSGVPLRDMRNIFQPFPKEAVLFGEPRRPLKKKRRERGEAFATFLKVRGKFKKVSKKPLHKDTALSLGSFLADETAAQTFKVLPVMGTPVGPRKKTTRIKKKFRKPIRKGVPQLQSNLFIEKTKFLIDKPGEKEEITLKGLEALRRGFFKKRKSAKKRRR